MVVTRRDLESLLTELSARVEDPRAGLFGPRSLAWHINREAVLFAGGGAAALLQLAHPAVSHAIEQHSPTRNDPSGRFIRTFTAVFTMLFGDLTSTLKAARDVHKTHARIRGPIHVGPRGTQENGQYAANDPEALLWVFATLVHTTVQTYSLFVRPLREDERERYYDEMKAFGQLFGLAHTRFPITWAAFERYVAQVSASEHLYVTPYARELAQFLLSSPARRFAPLMRGYRVLTAGLLPERLREPYGLPMGPRAERYFELEVKAVRALVHTLPARLRFVPAYVDAQRRLAGKGPDHIGRWLERTVARHLPQAAR